MWIEQAMDDYCGIDVSVSDSNIGVSKWVSQILPEQVNMSDMSLSSITYSVQWNLSITTT